MGMMDKFKGTRAYKIAKLMPRPFRKKTKDLIQTQKNYKSVADRLKELESACLDLAGYAKDVKDIMKEFAEKDAKHIFVLGKLSPGNDAKNSKIRKEELEPLKKELTEIQKEYSSTKGELIKAQKIINDKIKSLESLEKEAFKIIDGI